MCAHAAYMSCKYLHILWPGAMCEYYSSLHQFIRGLKSHLKTNSMFSKAGLHTGYRGGHSWKYTSNEIWYVFQSKVAK